MAVLITICPGRALRWAPSWDCADSAVLFDAASGDYWVLAPEARELIQALQRDGAMAPHALRARVSAVTSEAAALIDNLAQAGLLAGLVDGLAVKLPRTEAED